MLPEFNASIGLCQPDERVHVPRCHRHTTSPGCFSPQFGIEGRELLGIDVAHFGRELAGVDNELLEKILTDWLSMHLLMLQPWLFVLLLGGCIGMRTDVTAHDVVCQHLILHRISFVSQDTREIEAAENGIAQVDILGKGPLRVVSALCRICHCHDGASRLKSGNDSSLGDRDRLLLHGFVKRSPILVVHLVELIDQAHAIICQDHGTTLQAPLSCLITIHGRSQTHSTGSFACCVDRPREDLLNVLQELALAQSGVPDDESVDVTADAVLPCYLLLPATHDAQSDRCLDMPHAINRRCHGGDEPFTEIRALRQLQDLTVLLVGDLDQLQVALARNVDSIDVRSVDWEACACIRCNIVQAPVDAGHLQLIPRTAGVNHVSCQDHFSRSGHFPGIHCTRALLQRDLLIVLVDGLLPVYPPRALRLALETLGRPQIRLLGYIQRPDSKIALGTSHPQPPHLIEHVCSLRRNALHLDELVHVAGAEPPNGVFHRETADRNPKLILTNVGHRFVGLELPSSLQHQRLVQEWQDLSGRIVKPHGKRTAPLLQVMEAHLQMSLVLFSHLPEGIWVLWDDLALCDELDQELLEGQSDLVCYTLFNLHTRSKPLLVEVVLALVHIFVLAVLIIVVLCALPLLGRGIVQV
mmetsp:Transcript_58862/g.81687  ORF Transcript_58862/g.81687 Transcript_58862/m.81687 type:complete len:641 (+) Transcript_58862:409-2331(+)